MTKVEFLLMLLVISQFMMISIELATFFVENGVEFNEEDDDDGKDNDE